MLGTVIIVLVVAVVLYYLYINDKLNFTSLNNSESGQSAQSSAVEAQTGTIRTRFGGPVGRQIRVAHGDNQITSIHVVDAPVSFHDAVDYGTRKVGASSVFVGRLTSDSGADSRRDHVSGNLTLKRFANSFIVFKNLKFETVATNNAMHRFETEGLTLVMTEPAVITAFDALRDPSYPLVVHAADTPLRERLESWGYRQLSDTLYAKNINSHRVM